MITHTANTSLYSFAAEVVFHAQFAFEVDIPVIGDGGYNEKVYQSAIRADMAVGEDKESGFSDSMYYNHFSPYIVAQKLYHNEGDYIE